MVVGLTTTELLAALIVGLDGGGVVTEMTGSWTGCVGGAGCASCANACPHSKNTATKDTTVRPTQLKLRRAAIGESMDTPRVTRPVARHRELGVPLIP
jgi:hypothetical protein